MEEWHQKLHNNTSPDDVVICQVFRISINNHLVDLNTHSHSPTCMHMNFIINSNWILPVTGIDGLYQE